MSENQNQNTYSEARRILGLKYLATRELPPIANLNTHPNKIKEFWEWWELRYKSVASKWHLSSLLFLPYMEYQLLNDWVERLARQILGGKSYALVDGTPVCFYLQDKAIFLKPVIGKVKGFDSISHGLSNCNVIEIIAALDEIFPDQIVQPFKPGNN